MEKANEEPWYRIKNEADVISPSILVYPDRIEENIRRMIAIAGSAGRLRPHVKTHKMPEIVRLQMKHGISKFKCSTISEIEMVARCGAPDILLAMQPVGPNIERFFRLRQQYRDLKISCIADNEESVSMLSDAASDAGLKTEIWLDINNGMNRTGIAPGRKAELLYRKISSFPMISQGGLHVYDGHLHQSDPLTRKALSDEAFRPVEEMVSNLQKDGIRGINIIAGGTPTFPVHAMRKDVELSPGTMILWDYGYSESFRDLEFLHAAVLLMRIVSKPADDLLCLDLGHKAVASEMPQPRVMIQGIDNYTVTGHNEEHLVIKTSRAPEFKTGDILYGIPWHICPTIDRHDTAIVVRDNIAAAQWTIEARRRRLIF